MARLSDHGIRLSSMSPSFLNSNSTSHIWPFSAVAELVDNALDPGVSAKQIWIDVVEEAGQLCLTFIDNGSGMTPNKLHKMLSFGFTDKGSGKATQQAIGLYGNGFKSGSMRLGRDALIFTKNGGCQTVGMLSQSYLEDIQAQAIIVPIVPFSQQTNSLVVTEDSEASLAAILQHSIVSCQEQIHAHFDSILSKKGTKIIIWNIRRDKDGKLEIDFETDAGDFRLPEIQIEELRKGLRGGRSLRAEENIPDMHYSLRAYLSILYLKPRIQIILRAKTITAKLVSKSLTHIEHDVYKPKFRKEKVKVTFGLNPRNKVHYGILMYHRNRLIKAYEKVGCQLKASGQRAGVGVIGIIECDFLRPAHNKQDFEYTKEYRLTLGALGLKLNDYWKEVTEKRARELEFQALDSREENEDEPEADEDPVWLQCDECRKWRSVPAKHYDVVPESWVCSRNPNPRYRSCSAPEEAEESGELLAPSYQKNQKKQEHHKSRKRERSLEAYESKDQEAKHQILSRKSSEPIQPTYQSAHTPERRHKEENKLARDGQHTDRHIHTHRDEEAKTPNRRTQTQQTPVGRDTVIRDEMQIAQRRGNLGKEANSLSGESGETDEQKDTEVESVEREESTDTLSPRLQQADNRSTQALLLNCGRKRSDSGNTADEMTPETRTLPWDKTEQDGAEKPTDLTWTPSSPPAQTALVPPQSRAVLLPLHVTDREAEVQKLAGLEKEARGLRRLLGLEATESSQGTRTAARREVGCQTDVAESVTSSSIQALTALVQSQRPERGRSEQPEQNRPRGEKSETPSRTRASDSEAREGSRSAQEDLRAVRNNLVVLLTALLPQLDLADISLETPDVDNILQQILEVNSLKL